MATRVRSQIVMPLSTGDSIEWEERYRAQGKSNLGLYIPSNGLVIVHHWLPPHHPMIFLPPEARYTRLGHSGRCG